MRLFAHRTWTDERSHGQPWALWRWFDIWKDGRIYLTRLTLFRCPLFQVMLHWIKQPDQDRGLHDHPWSFFSIILHGEYYETEAQVCSFDGRFQRETRDGQFWLKDLRTRFVRLFNWKGLNKAHKITRIDPRGVVTLVFTGPKRKSWGFYEEDFARRRIGSWVPVKYNHWLDYLETEL